MACESWDDVADWGLPSRGKCLLLMTNSDRLEAKLPIIPVRWRRTPLATAVIAAIRFGKVIPQVNAAIAIKAFLSCQSLLFVSSYRQHLGSFAEMITSPRQRMGGRNWGLDLIAMPTRMA